MRFKRGFWYVMVPKDKGQILLRLIPQNTYRNWEVCTERDSSLLNDTAPDISRRQPVNESDLGQSQEGGKNRHGEVVVPGLEAKSTCKTGKE
jgi:hypothetical protein